jgi:hypothetical protein
MAPPPLPVVRASLEVEAAPAPMDARARTTWLINAASVLEKCDEQVR